VLLAFHKPYGVLSQFTPEPGSKWRPLADFSLPAGVYALGRLDAEIFSSRRPGSDRATWFWCAPSLGYLPLKVERRNGTKVEWSMAIQKVDRP
jgi:hypothetical protein